MTDGAWIDTVRLARDMGDVSQLLPEGILSVRDLPYSLMHAIQSGLRYLHFEEMEEDDVPPRNIWTDHKELKAWFKGVREKHDNRVKGTEIDDPVTNDAASLLIS